MQSIQIDWRTLESLCPSVSVPLFSFKKKQKKKKGKYKLSAGYRRPLPTSASWSVCQCVYACVCFSVLSHAVKPVLAPSQFEAQQPPYPKHTIPSHILTSWHRTSLFLAKRLIVTDKRTRETQDFRCVCTSMAAQVSVKIAVPPSISRGYLSLSLSLSLSINKRPENEPCNRETHI